MSIERNEPIHFHEQGTLEAVTRWIATHHDGIAELLKNVRRQYQVDRANVAENHRVAALLLQDAKDRQAGSDRCARCGRRDARRRNRLVDLAGHLGFAPGVWAPRKRDARQWRKSIHVSSVRWTGACPRHSGSPPQLQGLRRRTRNR